MNSLQVREETEHTMLRMLEEMCGKIQDDVKVGSLGLSSCCAGRGMLWFLTFYMC